MAIGLDFGTTNSALAVAGAGGTVRLAHLETMAKTAPATTLASLIHFDAEERGPDRRPLAQVGAAAVKAALDPHIEGRLVQSVKSYLASRDFTQTRIYGSKYEIEDLIAVILKVMRERTEEETGRPLSVVTVGRPAKYVGADTDKLAIGRMSGALTRAGIADFRFEYEPIAAAFAYERRLNHDELVLIGDFGGGTSDFSLVRVGPGRRDMSSTDAILAVDGVGLAGDALDARIVEHVVAPALGRGSNYRAPSGKTLPVPMWLYEALRQWHRLSFLDTAETRAVLGELIAGQDDARPLLGLKSVIEDRLGFHLAKAVEAVKIALSGADAAPFVFEAGPVRIERIIERSEFEAWIAPFLAQIAVCIDRLLETAGIAPNAVDAVFLTGGTAYVPAVRALFETRFGASKLRGGDELVSVALGLALSGAEADAARGA